MTTLLRPRRIATVVALMLAWCGLWRELSAATVIVGTVVAMAVTATGVGTAYRGGIRVRPLLRLSWLVFVDLAKSTINVAAEILTPTDHTEEAIIAVQVPAESRDHLLLLVVAITLTPGTAVVDADADTGTLYLHLLHHDRRAQTVAHVDDLVRLACAALPTRTTGATPC